MRCGQRPPLHFAQTVGEERQRAFGRQRRIELTDAACGAIARVDQVASLSRCFRYND
jgi:hypothetical protein